MMVHDSQLHSTTVHGNPRILHDCHFRKIARSDLHLYLSTLLNTNNETNRVLIQILKEAYINPMSDGGG